jgi:hypothetical protein
MEKKAKIKPAAGSKATSRNVKDRLLFEGEQAVRAKNCPALQSCVENTHNCPKLRKCTVNAGTCPKLAKAAAA